MSQTCVSYTYTLCQLGQRDAIVVKSVIRLLQSKTRHTWLYRDDGNADLVLLGDQPSADSAEVAPASRKQKIIHVNSAGRREANALTWPIRTDEFLNRLDAAGDQLAQCDPSPAGNLPAASGSQQGSSSGSPGAALMQRMSLLRWPDAALLQRDQRFTKLATMLTGRPVNVVELAARSGCPLGVCQGFADLLAAARLLRVVEPVAPIAQALAAPAAPDASARQAVQITQTGQTIKPVPQAPRGLIARIRKRLETIIGSPAERQARQ